MKSPLEMSLPELHAHAVKVFRRGEGSRPQVALIEADGARAVLKDYSYSDPRFRRLVGPLLVWREALALTRLAGQRGVPRLLRRFGGQALLIEYLPGEAVKGMARGSLPAGFFERFYRLVDEIHARGVAHCDLRSEGNILLTAAGEPCFVDFVAHLGRGPWWNPIQRWAFRRLCEADRVAVARLKRTHQPQLLSEEEKLWLARDRNTPFERGARVLGRGIRDLSRRLLTRRGR
jgi:RIO-like serine/threonine protein kinase